jgi:hypothetical protein
MITYKSKYCNACRLSNRENLEPSLQVKTEQDRTLRDIRPQETAPVRRHKEALVSYRQLLHVTQVKTGKTKPNKVFRLKETASTAWTN